MSGADSENGAAGRRHPDLGPELRQLAQAILDKLDPAMRAAAAYTSVGGQRSPGPCQQVWCPVCALAALVSGEEHPLLSVIAEHSVALLAVIQAMVDDIGGGGTAGEPPPDGPPGGGADAEGPSSSGPGRYQHIPITVED